MPKRENDLEESDSEECIRARKKVEKLKADGRSIEEAAQSPKNRTDFRVVSWNVDGISRFVQPEEQITDYFKTPSSSRAKVSLRHVLQRLDWPDVLALQETKCYLKDVPRFQRLIDKDTEPHGPGYRLYHNLPGQNLDQARREKRFGRGSAQAGVFTLVKDTVNVLEHETVDWDDEGRVSILEFGKVTLYNLYLLNGSQSPYKDPRTSQIVSTRNERKRDFNRKLSEEITLRRAKGKSCLLVGDMNVSISSIDCYPRLRTESEHAQSRREYIKLFLGDLGLVDIVRSKYGPHARKFTWFSRNVPQGEDCARVDHILISPDLSEGCEADTMEQFDRLGSDHAPMYFSIDRKRVL